MFSNTDVNTLFSLRSRMIECKVNFKSKHQNNNLKCLTPDREAKQVFIVITDSITRYQAPICIDNLQSMKYKG